jgi:hypothetical protein
MNSLKVIKRICRRKRKCTDLHEMSENTLGVSLFYMGFRSIGADTITPKDILPAGTIFLTASAFNYPTHTPQQRRSAYQHPSAPPQSSSRAMISWQSYNEAYERPAIYHQIIVPKWEPALRQPCASPITLCGRDSRCDCSLR